MKFSFSKRSEIISQLKSNKYDVLVIGGGITGAGIALDAATRGLKVALVEKQDFSSGTSSRSTKLIHGGLRYLKQGDIALVREVGTERAIVHQIAPHLVLPEKMLLPLVQDGNYGYLATSAGLWVYDILAKVKMKEWRTMLNKAKTIEKEPLLRTDILKGGGFYAEYRTDDARLTIEVIKTGVANGVDALNYCHLEQFAYDNEKISSAVCKDELTGETFSVNAHFIVNATGPWVDGLREKDNSLKDKHLHLTKGVHLVVAHEKFPVKQSVYFDVPDGRMLFAIPRGKITYIGTTDTNYKGNMEEPEVNIDDTEYLLDSIKHLFPGIELKIEDVLSSWAGLRPLIHEDGKLPSELSRKDEIFVADSGLISIAGGKLTGYRKMAERVVGLISKKLQETEKRYLHKCNTDKIPLTGGVFEGIDEVDEYIRIIEQTLINTKIDYVYTSKYLVYNYGKQTDEIVSRFLELRLEEKEMDDESLMVKSELLFCIQNEMVCKATDFFIRRTGRLYFDIESVRIYAELVFNVLKTNLNLSEEELELQKKDLELMLDRASLKILKQIAI